MFKILLSCSAMLLLSPSLGFANEEGTKVEGGVSGTESGEKMADHTGSNVNSKDDHVEHNASDDGENVHRASEDVTTASEEYEIDQKNKAFSRNSITVDVGDKIRFVNSDSYFHNVYSLSEIAQFDLGSYAKGESRSITLDKAGEIVAQCAIHPQMRIVITVEDK